MYVPQTVHQSSASANDPVIRKEALLASYGSNFKYTEFQVMSSITSVILYTGAMFFGIGMLLVKPVSHNNIRIVFFCFYNFYSDSLSCQEHTSKSRRRSLRSVSLFFFFFFSFFLGGAYVWMGSRQMRKGFFDVTNITASTTSPPVQVMTVIKGRGDPGYLLTSGVYLFLLGL